MGAKLVRLAIIVHRWLGIPMSILFALWFASGAVMLFVPFPSLPSGERLRGSPPIDATAIRIAPATATATAERSAALTEVTRIRIIGSRTKAPLYVVDGFSSGTAVAVAVDAQTGLEVAPLDAHVAERIATDFYFTSVPKQPPVTISGPFDYDQWVVHQRFDPVRPFFKASFADPRSTDLYVSSRTGEVLQRTTRHERGWNLLGAVTHWIYPTIIRRDWALWDGLVWWLSLVGVFVVVLGLSLGLLRLRSNRSLAGWSAWTPYRGWLRWHHLLGLGCGLLVLTWITSGWLSMDHGRLFSTADPEPQLEQRYYRTSLRAAIGRLAVSDLAVLTGYNEGELLVFDGEPLVVARSATQRKVFLRNTGSGSTSSVMQTERIGSVLRRAWPDDAISQAEVITPSDLYGNLLDGPLPASAVRFRVSDPERTWVHVDSETGQLINTMNRSRRLYRWFYNGLHSFDVPVLAQRPLLRKAIMLPLLAAGFALSLTSVAISASALRSRWRRMRRQARITEG